MMPETPWEALIELPNTDAHNCFACSPANASGLQMKFFTDNERIYARVVVPRHMGGWNRIAHGGILSTILDETMGWAGIYLLEQLTLTKTMTIDFVKAVMVGEELRCQAWVQERTGKREAIIKAALYNADDEICAESNGIFTMLTLALAKRIGMINDEFETSFFNPLMKSKQ
ncbi:MAG: PaaI family thioesterase [Thermodesulfobacteriota bacterium]